MRAAWYSGMQALRNDSTQMNGLIIVSHNIGSVTEPDFEYVRKTAVARHAVPLRVCSNHVLVNDPNQVPLLKFAPYFLERTTRLRFRAHFGKCERSIMFEVHYKNGRLLMLYFIYFSPRLDQQRTPCISRYIWCLSYVF